MNITINADRIIKVQSATGLTDVVLKVYEGSTLSRTIPMTEVLPGIYSCSLSLSSVGNYTGIVSSALSSSEDMAFDLNVIGGGYEVKPDLTIMNENIKKASLLIPANQNLT